MKYLLQHRVYGYFLSSVRSSVDVFRWSPNESEAVHFTTFDDADRERKQLHEFGSSWMVVSRQER